MNSYDRMLGGGTVAESAVLFTVACHFKLHA